MLRSLVGSEMCIRDSYHSYPEDSPENMVAFINRHHIPFPYLIDETQQVAKAYAAVCTPDFFGLNSEGKLHYRGRLDDVKMGTGDNRQPELLEAMIKVVESGQGPEHQIPSMGCSIKWK